MVWQSRTASGRVHSIHMMNVEPLQMVFDPQRQVYPTGCYYQYKPSPFCIITQAES